MARSKARTIGLLLCVYDCCRTKFSLVPLISHVRHNVYNGIHVYIPIFMYVYFMKIYIFESMVEYWFSTRRICMCVVCRSIRIFKICKNGFDTVCVFLCPHTHSLSLTHPLFRFLILCHLSVYGCENLYSI